MSDIIITLPKSRGGYFHLLEKIQATQSSIIGSWWEFSRLPKKLDLTSKIYVVCEGYLRGYFTISRIDQYQNVVFLLSWQEIEPKEMKGFQGYRYYQEEES